MAGLLALQAETASAFTCRFPQALLFETDKPLPSEEEMLRLRSIELSKFIQPRTDGDLVVVGRFFKNEASPFLHERQLENNPALHWPPSKNAQMPAQIEYTYFDAYRFEGHQILSGALVPFVDEGIDIRISILSDYEGAATGLPPTSEDVIGALLPSSGLNGLQVESSLCPTYLPIEAAQLADLLACINSGECG